MGSNIVKSEIYNVKFKGNIFSNDFGAALEELARNLDSDDASEKRILDISRNSAETSIWFDSLDNQGAFNNELFTDSLCFLLAKDLQTQFVEDKENKTIKTFDIYSKQKPKAPAHCVYLKREKRLLIETSTNAPTVSTLLRGIKSKLGLPSDDLIFEPIYREDILQRLNSLVENIKSIELVDLKINKYLSKTLEEDIDGKLLSLITHENSKLGLTLSVETDKNWKQKAVDIFANILQNKNERLMGDMKINYTDERKINDTASLFENLVYLKVEKDFNFVEDIESIQNLDRIEYSKIVYQTIIEAYLEQKNDF